MTGAQLTEGSQLLWAVSPSEGSSHTCTAAQALQAGWEAEGAFQRDLDPLRKPTSLMRAAAAPYILPACLA